MKILLNWKCGRENRDFSVGVTPSHTPFTLTTISSFPGPLFNQGTSSQKTILTYFNTYHSIVGVPKRDPIRLNVPLPRDDVLPLTRLIDPSPEIQYDDP